MQEMKDWEDSGFWRKSIFVAFLLSIPFSIRKVFFVVSPLGSLGFNEYSDISLYLSDVLFLIFFLCILLENKISKLSTSYWKNLFHVEQVALLLIAPVFFVLWTGLSIYWAKSETLALYSFFKVTEGYFLYLTVILWSVPRGTTGTGLSMKICSTWNKLRKKIIINLFHVEQVNENTMNIPRQTLIQNFWYFVKYCSTWNNTQVVMLAMIFSGFIQSLFAIFQFLLQRSLGAIYLKESIFLASDPGVAKIVLSGKTLVRAYGFFPHPNVLAGYLGLTILITVVYPYLFRKNLFHVEQMTQKSYFVPRGTRLSLDYFLNTLCSTWNKVYRSFFLFHVEQKQLLYRFVLAVQIFGFLFTFSKVAFIGLIIALSYILYVLFHVEQNMDYAKSVPRGTTGTGLSMKICSTWNKLRKKIIINLFHVEQVNENTMNIPRQTLIQKFWYFVKYCSTWNKYSKENKPNIKNNLFHVEQRIYSLTFLIIIFFGLLFISQVNFKYFFFQPLYERLYLSQEIYGIAKEHFIFGLGAGQSVFMMQKYFSEDLASWQFQPVHNLFLLIFSETGFIGLILFGLFLFQLLTLRKYVPRGTRIDWRYFSNLIYSTWNSRDNTSESDLFHVEQISKHFRYVPRGTIVKQDILVKLFLSAILFILWISLFDHYFWDIQQGQLLLWLFLGLFAAQKLSLVIDKK